MQVLDSNIKFYNVLHDIAKAYPPTYEADGLELTCKRLNGFAVLHNEDDVNSDNLDKSTRYIGKRLFFSRSWSNKGYNPSAISHEYPLLAISPSNSQIKSPFNTQSSICTTFNIYIFDHMPSKCSTCPTEGYCNNRTWDI